MKGKNSFTKSYAAILIIELTMEENNGFTNLSDAYKT